ncbi:MAG: GNAT family N-acetyltransferase [Acidimicrobiales bacterium]|nr:GNAT family N-acetyltransferase [Acidimicrobiales bacterium]RZV43425.1 MAG: GNAT family N-acetyltransferase [Acidimicrobiales bacterium]
MDYPREELRVGLDWVDTMTTLLQRARSAHPTYGSYEAAEIQWWWRSPRSTDTFPQLFWFDDQDRPEAAMIAADFGGGGSAVYEDTTLVFLFMPDPAADWVAHVVERGLAHVAEHGIETVELEVDQTDDVMRNILVGHGFALKGDAVVEAWLAADSRPEVSPLHDGYRLLSRTETMDRPHHLALRNGDDVEQRLQQLSLYRADLDLVILDSDDNVAAYGLFWHDPVTSTGVVEPMRTLDEHQQKGLARHILTAGVDLLAKAGAERISIGYEPANPASGHLYRSVGFVPDIQTDVFAR